MSDTSSDMSDKISVETFVKDPSKYVVVEKYSLTKEVHYKVEELTEEAKSALMAGDFAYTWGDSGGGKDLGLDFFGTLNKHAGMKEVYMKTQENGNYFEATIEEDFHLKKEADPEPEDNKKKVRVKQIARKSNGTAVTKGLVVCAPANRKYPETESLEEADKKNKNFVSLLAFKKALNEPDKYEFTYNSPEVRTYYYRLKPNLTEEEKETIVRCFKKEGLVGCIDDFGDNDVEYFQQIDQETECCVDPCWAEMLNDSESEDEPAEDNKTEADPEPEPEDNKTEADPVSSQFVFVVYSSRRIGDGECASTCLCSYTKSILESCK